MREFAELIPFLSIYAVLCWIILPAIEKKGVRILIGLALFYPAKLIAEASGPIFAKIMSFFTHLLMDSTVHWI